MILDILLSMLVLISAFIIYRQDQTIKRQIDYIDSIEVKLLNTFESIRDSYNKMKSFDDKGGFESDDEVGQVFKNIKETIEDLENEVNG